jgi:hypothetical protein
MYPYRFDTPERYEWWTIYLSEPVRLLSICAR